MAKNIFEMSAEGKSEYCIDVIRVGTLNPIEGSDFLAQTFIGDASIVVRKDQVNEGDLLFYAANECQLNEKFLSVNNLFEIGCYEKNSNEQEVEQLIKEGNKDAAKKKCGFFNHHGRVRMIRLKGTPSMGYLFSLDEMAKYCPKVKDINLEDWLNVDFDTVDGELFVKAYVPPVKEKPQRGDGAKKRNKKLKQFDRIIPGEFSYHYDTSQLGKNMWRINPDDNVVISNKLHGTSLICGNIKIKTPLKIAFYKRWFNKIVDRFGIWSEHRFTDYIIEYGNVYSSRSVIKNQFINENVGEGYYKFDIWGEANEVLKPYLSEGMTVYAEICGYAGDKMIQKGYDYGCKEGDFFIMPYRITTNTDDGGKYEWEVMEVKAWTEHLIKEHPDIADKVHSITVFYHGTLAGLYPDLSTTEHWHENVLHAMMNDKEHFGMEELEPMCKNKVPREGLVLRIDKDPMAEAFKLKSNAFREREAKAYDKGEVDIEAQEGYGNN